MDIFTHALLPFALLVALGRRRAEGLAAGLGAAAPDMDVLLTWVARLGDGLYVFTHRGWSHTLWGAPLVGVFALVVLSRPWWARRWPRLAAFRVDRFTLAAAAFGGLSHVMVDMLTISGVPLLWPWDTGRVTAGLFFFSILYMTPVGAYLIWRLAKGTLDNRLLLRGTALLVVLLVVSGAVRGATYPRDVPEGAVVQPTPSEVRWIVATPVPGGWDVEDRVAALGEPARTVQLGNATPDAAPAIARAQRLGAYIAWAWTNPAPVVNTTALGDGAWRVEFRDAFALHRNATGGFLAGAFRHPEALVIEVRGEAAVAVQRPSWFGLG